MVAAAAAEVTGGRFISRFSLLPLAADLERLVDHLGEQPGAAAVGLVRDRMKSFEVTVVPSMAAEENGLYRQVEQRLGDAELRAQLCGQHRHILAVAGQVGEVLDRLTGAEGDVAPAERTGAVRAGKATTRTAGPADDIARLRLLLGLLVRNLREHNRLEERAVAAYLEAHLQSPQPGRLTHDD